MAVHASACSCASCTLLTPLPLPLTLFLQQVLVNSAAPKQSLGAVNGAGQSLASAVRAAGPALGGLAWGWSTSLAKAPWWPAWLPHQYAPFMISAAMAAGTDLVYHGLRMPAEAEEASHRGGRKPGADGSGDGSGDDA